MPSPFHTGTLDELKIKSILMNATEINNSDVKIDLTVFDCKGVAWTELVQNSVQGGTVV